VHAAIGGNQRQLEAVSHGVHVAIRGNQRQLEAVSHGVHVAGEMHRRLCKETTRLGDDPDEGGNQECHQMREAIRLDDDPRATRDR
jgi:hypothetical protein